VQTRRYDNDIRKQLEQFSELPEGIRLDLTKTWQQLEYQLQQKRPAKNPWLKLAAVFILIMVSAVLFLINSTRDNKITNKNNKDILNAPAATPVVFKQKPAANDPAAMKHLSHVTLPVVAKEKNRELNQTAITGNNDTMPLPSTNNPVIITDQPIAGSSTIIKPSQIQPTNAVPKKPKLKVVHLNELYQPDPADIVKVETKKQLREEAEPEPVIATPARLFWKSKAPQKTISLNDNQ
jgi:hypothetical protein